MLSIQESVLRDSDRNSDIRTLARQVKESNRAWLIRALADARFKQVDVAILLIGGRNSLDLPLRFAQSLARYDRSPSSWSEAGLVVLGKRRIPRVFGIHLPSIMLPMQHRNDRLLRNVPTWNNGVQDDVLASIDNPVDYPNIALIGMGAPILEEVGKRLTDASPKRSIDDAISQFRRRQDVIAVADSAWRWLGYCWGVRDQQNPLHQGFGLPSAMFVEIVMASIGVDITPGLASNSSCPEALWQTFNWWHRETVNSDSGKAVKKGRSRYFGSVHRGHMLDTPPNSSA